MNRRRGQSILEYIIILTAIVAGVVIGVQTFTQDKTKGLGLFYSNAGQSVVNASNGIVAVVP